MRGARALHASVGQTAALAVTLAATVAASVAASVASGGCSDRRSDAATAGFFGRVPDPDPQHLTICAMGDPDSLDPARSTSSTEQKVVHELFDGLTTFDREALPIPSLATGWETSADLRTFTFHLRADARWSDGRPLVAADFVYSLARVLHPATAALNADSVQRLRHGAAYHAGTARVVLRDSPPFRAGEAVEQVVGAATADAHDPAGAPGPNVRVPRVAVPLRAAPDPAAALWATAPAGAAVVIVERTCPAPDACWAYVQAPAAGDEGAFGWLPLGDDLAAPNADRPYRVRGLDRVSEGSVLGRDLLMLPDLLGARAPDPHTLVLETDGPTPFLVFLTQQHAFRPVPREAVSRWPRTWTSPDHIVTSGPFHLASRRARDLVELVRSPTFFDAAHVRLGRVTFLALESQATSANVYHQGGCDAVVANNLPSSYLPALRGRRDLVVAPALGTYFLLVNTARFPDVHFRRALALALDRRALAGLLRGGQRPTEQLVPGTPVADLSPAERALCGVAADAPGVALLVDLGLCYVPPAGPGFDPAAARRELALARAALGPALPARLTFRYNGEASVNRTVAGFVQAAWQDTLGLRVELESMEWKTYLQATAAHDFDVGRMTWLGGFPDPESEFLAALRCGAADNRPAFCDAEVDRLLAGAEHEGDRRRRLELVRQAEARVIDAAPVIPLFGYTQVVLQKPYVRDLYVNLTDHQSLRATWIDPDWRTR